MATLTWLHLSDLHACTPRFAWDADRVTQTLVADLKKLQVDHGLRPDLVFFTGDAAFGEIGTEPEKTIRGQLERFDAFLREVRTAFEPEITLEDVFLVPGNHDVHRGWAMPEHTAWLDAQEAIEPVRALIQAGGPRWRYYTERLRDYRTFLEEHGLRHLLDDPERLIYSTVRDVNGIRVGVAGFNSAWSCCRDGERGRLWMAGQWQQGVIRPNLKDVDFAIALVHHPPDWLVEHETPDFGRGLEHDFRFLLHGHEHRDWVLMAPAEEASADLAQKIFRPADPRTSSLEELATNPLMRGARRLLGQPVQVPARGLPGRGPGLEPGQVPRVPGGVSFRSRARLLIFVFIGSCSCSPPRGMISIVDKCRHPVPSVDKCRHGLLTIVDKC